MNLWSRATSHMRGARKILPLLILPLSACTSFAAAGPSSQAVRAAADTNVDQSIIKIVDVTDVVNRRVIGAGKNSSFAEVLGDVPPIGSVIGTGDVLEVSIWEAPPAALFGGSAKFGSSGTGSLLTSSPPQQAEMPEMMVDSAGLIRIPFAGSIRAAGRTPHEVESEIIARLAGKAHDPQVIVRSVTNANATVAVVGEVGTNSRVTLTPRGERLLDVLASAGGVKQPVGKTTIQITRGNQLVSAPMDAVIRDPAQNIRLQPNDVITALYQPYSFISLGATGVSNEISFESTGLTLSQALGRVGGLKDDRANVKGVFIFRFEDPSALSPELAATDHRTPEGKIPVIYRVDLSNPATLFVAQDFPMRNKDVLYVSSAPLSDIQRFFNIVSSMALTAIGLGQAVP